MDRLPNDIIMRIIREADGGRNTHKENFQNVIWAIGEVYDEMELFAQPMNIWGPPYVAPEPEQFFRELHLIGELTQVASKRRENKVR
tara:strand:- start:273 stop:533 length:261 start_codon:yes stop_codon:yes gene_type:complete